jgi:hypothetical protein
MQFTYKFPAMTTILRRSAAQASLCMVTGLASARIEEVSPQEAPVAATISIKSRDGGVPFRFHDGRFYIEARGGIDGALRHMGGELLRGICDELLRTKKHAAAIQPKEAQNILWDVWRHGRDTPPVVFDENVLPDRLFDGMKDFDPGRYDSEHFERWKTYCEDLVSQLRMIDGNVWRPTREPILVWNSAGALNRWIFDDIGVYDLFRGRAKNIPAPYGRGAMPGFLSSFQSDFRYWKPQNRHFSLPDADRLTEAYRANRDFSVSMPEAFEADITGMEMVRAARLAVASMRHELEQSSTGDYVRLDEDLAYHYKRLVRLTADGSDSPTSDRLEDALLAFWQYANPRDDVRSPYHTGRKFGGQSGVASLVGDALHRWQNREVDLDFGPKTIVRPPAP